MKPRHVHRVDVVADLLALVAEDLVFAAFEVALHQVAEEAVQLDAGVVRAGQAAAAQAAGGQAEVAAILLHHDVRRDLGGAEERVLGLVDRKGLRGCRARRPGRRSPSAFRSSFSAIVLGRSP